MGTKSRDLKRMARIASFKNRYTRDNIKGMFFLWEKKTKREAAKRNKEDEKARRKTKKPSKVAETQEY